MNTVESPGGLLSHALNILVLVALRFDSTLVPIPTGIVKASIAAGTAGAHRPRITCARCHVGDRALSTKDAMGFSGIHRARHSRDRLAVGPTDAAFPLVRAVLPITKRKGGVVSPPYVRGIAKEKSSDAAGVLSLHYAVAEGSPRI
jgi:hypothetical protein